MDLSKLFSSNIRLATQHETETIIKKILHIRDEDFKGIVDEKISGNILQVGLSPRNIEVDGQIFRALCNFRFVNDDICYEIQIEGNISNPDFPKLYSASVLSAKMAFRKAA